MMQTSPLNVIKFVLVIFKILQVLLKHQIASINFKKSYINSFKTKISLQRNKYRTSKPKISVKIAFDF